MRVLMPVRQRLANYSTARRSHEPVGDLRRDRARKILACVVVQTNDGRLSRATDNIAQTLIAAVRCLKKRPCRDARGTDESRTW